jgi:hypothetical protein
LPWRLCVRSGNKFFEQVDPGPTWRGQEVEDLLQQRLDVVLGSVNDPGALLH